MSLIAAVLAGLMLYFSWILSKMAKEKLAQELIGKKAWENMNIDWAIRILIGLAIFFVQIWIMIEVTP